MDAKLITADAERHSRQSRHLYVKCHALQPAHACMRASTFANIENRACKIRHVRFIADKIIISIIIMFLSCSI